MGDPVDALVIEALNPELQTTFGNPGMSSGQFKGSATEPQ